MNKRVSGRIVTSSQPFTAVSNTILADRSLSLKAKGLFAIIKHYAGISLINQDFVLCKSALENMCVEGERAFNSAWIELKEKGYIIQYKYPTGEKNAFYYEYEVLDEPNPEIYKKQQAEKKEKQKKKAMQEFNLAEKNENKQYGEHTDMPPQMFQQGQVSSSNRKSVNLDITFDE